MRDRRGGNLQDHRGDRKLGLDKSKVPEIKSPNVKKLELFRHGCFHFHPDAKKQLQFFKEGSDLGAMNWAELLHEQFHAFFRDYLDIPKARGQ